MNLTLSTEGQAFSRRITDHRLVGHQAENGPKERGDAWIALLLILVGVGWPMFLVVSLARLAWRIIAG